MYVSLGLEGTRRKAAIRVAGISRVFESRTELLRAMNADAPPQPRLPPPPRGRRAAKLLRRAPRTACEEPGGVVERMQEWAALKARKVRPNPTTPPHPAPARGGGVP